MKAIAVLHVDPDPGWRGGQQQAFYLHQGMLAQGLKSGFICSPGSELAKRLRHNQLVFHTIRHYFEADLVAALRLACFARKHGFTTLHLHSSHALSWGLLARCLYPSLKLVATRRVNVPISKNPLSSFKYKGRMLDAIVAISDAIVDIMLRDGICPQKIHRIYSGVDIHKFDDDACPSQFRQDWGIPEAAILVGTVAALVPPKDYPNFVNAAAIAAQSNPDLHFMVVGDGELRERIEELAQSKGLTGRITFTGFQSRVGTFLKAFDFFVLASKREGLGTSVLDAMSVGLAVIGTRAGGIAEMIEDERSGLLVEARNSAALAEAMLRLAVDEALRKQLGTQALERVKDFSKEHMVEANIRLYESL
jgi:L-malate glycosyltransferase